MQEGDKVLVRHAADLGPDLEGVVLRVWRTDPNTVARVVVTRMREDGASFEEIIDNVAVGEPVDGVSYVVVSSTQEAVAEVPAAPDGDA